MFVLEIRGSATEGSINRSGYFQTGLRAIEANVKDARLPGGWGFYNFGNKTAAVAPLPMRGRTELQPCVKPWKTTRTSDEIIQYAASPDGKFRNITVNIIGMMYIICRWVGSVTAPDILTAIDTAAKSCVNCRIHDLTADYVYGEAPWEAERVADNFCKEESK